MQAWDPALFQRSCSGKYQIKRASTIREAQAAVLEASPKLSMIGGLAPVKSLRGRDTLVDSIGSYYVYDRMQTAVNQFKEGLGTLGVLEKMHNKKAEEEQAVCFWRDWLNDVAAGEAFIQPEEDRKGDPEARRNPGVCNWGVLNPTVRF
ncbi:hypothetical protein DPEC_G00282370 [Dallia pectoralis]|uniref:Uncharacterized protein n=1 Tax=Dallia pectoralis TaxID=75939 RepID=A0ACC2FNE2_DALPE|nr:hypothetical protein DPEC_G00282370 [Dallia pectoralis]